MALPRIGPGGKPMLGAGGKPLVCETGEPCCDSPSPWDFLGHNAVTQGRMTLFIDLPHVVWASPTTFGSSTSPTYGWPVLAPDLAGGAWLIENHWETTFSGVRIYERKYHELDLSTGNVLSTFATLTDLHENTIRSQALPNVASSNLFVSVMYRGGVNNRFTFHSSSGSQVYDNFNATDSIITSGGYGTVVTYDASHNLYASVVGSGTKIYTYSGSAWSNAATASMPRPFRLVCDSLGRDRVYGVYTSSGASNLARINSDGTYTDLATGLAYSCQLLVHHPSGYLYWLIQAASGLGGHVMRIPDAGGTPEFILETGYGPGYAEPYTQLIVP